MMQLKLLFLITGYLASGVLIVESARWLWQNKARFKKLKSRLVRARVNEKQQLASAVIEPVTKVLFFPEQSLPCMWYYKHGLCKAAKCSYSHQAELLDCLLHYLGSAQRSLDICIYTFTSHELSRIILICHDKGVLVRIITDGTCGDEGRTRIGDLRSKGIEVRTNAEVERTIMHHKFALVDGRMLVNGSLNWTWQAITGNYENVFITNNEEIVQPYVDEFTRLWNKFDPAQKKVVFEA